MKSSDTGCSHQSAYRFRRTLTSALVVFVFSTVVSVGGQGKPSGAPERTETSGLALAQVDGESITVDEVEEALVGQLAKLEEQIYRLKRQRIDVLVDQRLLAREAARRGISPEALIAAEITAKAGTVLDEEIDAFYGENQGRLRAGSRQAREQILALLQQRKWEARGQQFIAELRAAAEIVVLLPEPRTLRVDLNTDGGYVRGPGDAKVTIVEFTDFHCPFCYRLQPTLSLVLAKYGGQVRFVHRDFPIDALHPRARQAHEAARCAGEQGGFWEYRDLLFSQSPNGEAEALAAHARELGLDMKTFLQCLDSGRFKEAIDRDIKEGVRAGVTGTPTVFINGRRLEGAKTLQSFALLIDEELTREETKADQAVR